MQNGAKKKSYPYIGGGKPAAGMQIFRPEARSRHGIRIHAVKRVEANPAAVHLHSGVELLYIRSGSGTTMIGGVAYPMTKGTLCVIPEGVTHEYTSEKPFSLYNILFGFDVFSRAEQRELLSLPKMKELFIAKKRNAVRILSLIPGCYETFETAADALAAEVNAADGYAPAASKALLKTVLIIVARAAASERSVIAGEATGTFSSMLGYIHEHYTEKITLASVAAAGGLSGSYAAVYFRKYAGVSVIEYVNMLRVEKAMHLLAGTELSVSEIAFRLGFEDASYFTLMFRRAAGKTPRVFREAVR
ncbi:MAG: helix-turn-helix transcriptional regulator [Spirochaetes bacterium]|nr:helix-turn-helix transcriptional regulator [Spirochaetota bacterium]